VSLRLVLAGFVFAQAQSTAYVQYSDAAPIFDALRPDLIPPDFRGKTADERAATWPQWVARRDAEIRTRVTSGDEDSVINFLLYGTTFTKKARPTERQISDLVSRPAEAITWLRPRIADFIAGTAAPAGNERLQFARDVMRRRGIDPLTPSGKEEAARYLEERTLAMSASGALRTRALLDSRGTELSDRLTLFRDRGLSSDTSIFIDYGVDATLEAIVRQRLLTAGTVRRVAIVGPGLDFSDKLDGYDFYPPQTIQPFAIVDSLLRFGLAARANLQVTAFDLSPRILQHLEAARTRASAGRPYTIVLPRNLDQSWSAPLVSYWRQVGSRIGDAGPPVLPPVNAGRPEVRSVLVRPAVVLSTAARDLNIVLQRPDPLPDAERFDLVIATNILLYYDVFEQSLAGINIAKMLRPGGLLLTNDRIFELPTTPLSGVGYTDVDYMGVPGIGNTGARIIWYERQ
jgi:SAM-dependent methyltransferase